MNGKKFRDNRTGEVVKVIDSFENIAILENKQKIDVRRLTDTNYFTEEIDPASFFNNQGAYNNLAEKIKNIPTNDIVDDDLPANVSSGQAVNYADNSYNPPVDDGSAVIVSSLDDEREELARKYGVSLDNKQAVVKQNEAFAQILGDENVNELSIVPQKSVYSDNNVQKVEVKRDDEGEVLQRPVARQEDPIHIMFRNAKKVVEFDLDLKLINKIPRLDFIEMMEDSYEKSIIDFLATEITNDLLKNPENLKFQISEKIKEMVYNRKPVRKPAAKKPTSKPVTKKITTKKPVTNLKEDLKTITQSEIEPVRKVRTKKETEQHD
jgi:hypothetical protein